VFAVVREAAPDVIVVAAYGLILRREVLDLPRLGCLNVHASLLPRHRGAAPISASILAGDAETGVCLMQMEAGLDTGPVLARLTTPIAPTDDTPTLTDRLALLGRDVLLDGLPRWAAGEIVPVPQDDALATYAPKISREDARLDWSRPADALWRQVRAYRGWPDAFTTWQGKQLKILTARPVSGGGRDGSSPYEDDGRPGRVVLVKDGGAQRPAVVTGDGLLVLETVALEGKRPTDGVSFLNGARGFVGAELGG
jgi:methionyl-tRNA formyltransferase